ncbi:axonemal dynein light intermediate polypeptide 1 [Pelomyxa schiedti]|nr:axonemal dynein light intermediate polypeptide 1 [Pelomyxa schiedti]
MPRPHRWLGTPNQSPRLWDLNALRRDNSSYGLMGGRAKDKTTSHKQAAGNVSEPREFGAPTSATRGRSATDTGTERGCAAAPGTAAPAADVDDPAAAFGSGVLPGLGDLDRDPTGNLCDILDAIVPKREFMKDSTHWEIHASTIPATRNDVILLAKEMQKRLVQRQARGTGLCPIRRELYSQLFDEIIRQETVNCTERGILLTHVRNELHTTLHAYLTLYESGIAFGLRKALDAEQGRVDLESKITTLEAEKQSLETQVAELKAKCEYIEKRDIERWQEEEKKHTEEVAFLKKVNLQLKAQLESILKKT